ncbi:site-specific recombinase [Vibrio cholerae]|nr:site-specific recombinase [Vibrio cholerae]
MPKLYIFRRVSSKRQTNKTGLKIQVRPETVERLLSEHGLSEVVDLGAEVASASKGKHIEEGSILKRFLMKCERGEIEQGSILAVYSLDRLSRLEKLGLAKSLIYLPITNNGVSIFGEIDNFLYKPHDVLSEILSSLVFERAAEESRAKKNRNIDSLAANLAQYQRDGQYTTKLGKSPSWINHKTGKLNEEAVLWREVINCYTSGQYKNLSALHTAMQLAIPYNTLSKVINNAHKTLIGTKVIKGVELAEFYEPLLTQEEYNRLLIYVRQMGTGKGKAIATTKTENIWLLKGLGECPQCGSLCGSFKNGASVKDKVRYNYRCNAAINKHCNSPTYNLNPIEAIVTLLSADYLHEVSQRETNTELNAKIEALQVEVERLETQLDQATQALNTFFSPELAQAIPKYREQLETAQNELQTLLALASNHTPINESLLSAEIILDKANPERMKLVKLLQGCINRVIVTRKSVKKGDTRFSPKIYTGCDYSLLCVRVEFIDGNIRVFDSVLRDNLRLNLSVSNGTRSIGLENFHRFSRRLREYDLIKYCVINNRKLKIT